MALKSDQLKMTSGPDGTMQLAMDVSKEELTNAPTFKSKRDQSSGATAQRAPRSASDARDQVTLLNK